MTQDVMENNSGQGKQTVVPAEVDRWNWGAFMLTWLWGLGNSTPLALLALVPCVGFAMPFVLGARGSAWAWQNKRWESVEQFRRTQRLWGVAGLGQIGSLVCLAVVGFFLAELGFKHSDAYQLAYRQLASDPRATSVLGTPIDSGFMSGELKTNGASGCADISFSVTGPKAHGTLYSQARKELGTWRILRMELAVDGTPSRIPLVVASPDDPPFVCEADSK